MDEDYRWRSSEKDMILKYYLTNTEWTLLNALLWKETAILNSDLILKELKKNEKLVKNRKNQITQYFHTIISNGLITKY